MIFTNELLPRKSEASVDVLKVNEKDKPLAGAKLEITGKDTDGATIDPIVWTSGTEARTIALTAGEYTLKNGSTYRLRCG